MQGTRTCIYEISDIIDKMIRKIFAEGRKRRKEQNDE